MVREYKSKICHCQPKPGYYLNPRTGRYNKIKTVTGKRVTRRVTQNPNPRKRIRLD
jgi:hypothetical protein